MNITGTLVASVDTSQDNFRVTENGQELFDNLFNYIFFGLLIVAALIGAGLLISWPFRKKTAGIMPYGYVGVVYRFKEPVEKKSVCPIDQDGNRIDAKRSLPWILDRIFWRHPIATELIQANVQWEPVSSDPETRTSAVLDGGVVVDFEVRGYARIYSPARMARTFNTQLETGGGDESLQSRYEAAVRTIRYTILTTAIATVLSQFEGLSFTQLRKQSPELLAEITRRVDEIGMQEGIRFRDIRFENINPHENVARDLAAATLVGPAVQAASMHALSIIGEGGELDQIEEMLRSRNPTWSAETVSEKAFEFLTLIAARQGGKGVDITMPASGKT